MIKTEIDESSLTRRGREMRRHLEEAEKRGESDGVLGARIGMKPGTIAWWRREIRRRTIRTRAAAMRTELIPVSVRPDERTTSTIGRHLFVVEVSGIRIEVPAGFSESELRRLIGAVRPC